jgi:hypothetical protein
MGAEMSPVIYAECQFVGGPQHLHVECWFKDTREIDALIDALEALKQSVDPQFDHIHLQQHNLSRNSDAAAAEVVFHRPGSRPNELHIEMIDDASEWLAAVKSRD